MARGLFIQEKKQIKQDESRECQAQVLLVHFNKLKPGRRRKTLYVFMSAVLVANQTCISAEETEHGGWVHKGHRA